MKKKHIIAALKDARSAGCSCLTSNSREICGACLASDILGMPAPRRRHGFAVKVARLVAERLK